MGPLLFVQRNMAFSQATADLICERLAGGESLRSVCRDPDLPSIAEVMRWLGDEANTHFREQYARAFQLRADAKFEELDDVSDEAVNAETAVQVQGLRLKADNIKWQLARMNAKKYGDKMELGGNLGLSVTGALALLNDKAGE